jgi:hypothetical protein
VNSADDAVHSNGGVHLASGDVSIATGDDAVHADTQLYIDGGTLDVTASYEGLESAAITIADGDITLVSSDDGINAAQKTTTEGTSDETAEESGQGGGTQGGDFSLAISGGTVVVNADGDGLDSNGTATISGGVVVVSGPTNSGNGALDVDGTFDISGGVLIAAGTSGMAVAPSTDSAQGWIAATLTSAVDVGEVVQVVDADGVVVATFEASKSFDSLVYSSMGITTGNTYSIEIGGTPSGDSVGGLFASADAIGSTVDSDVTAGESPAGGMGGGMGGGGNGGPGGGTPPSGQ